MTDLAEINTSKEYSIAEVSRLTGYNGRTLRRWIDKGLLKARRNGLTDTSPFVVPGSEVQRLIDQKKA